jgi:hypothetical protein
MASLSPAPARPASPRLALPANADGLLTAHRSPLTIRGSPQWPGRVRSSPRLAHSALTKSAPAPAPAPARSAPARPGSLLAFHPLREVRTDPTPLTLQLPSPTSGWGSPRTAPGQGHTQDQGHAQDQDHAQDQGHAQDRGRGQTQRSSGNNRTVSANEQALVNSQRAGSGQEAG